MREATDVDGMVSTDNGLPLGGPIVVATDGTHNSDAAVRMAVALSRHRAVDLQLISVVELLDFADYEGSSPADLTRACCMAIALREGELTAQRQRTRISTRAYLPAIRVGCRVEEIVSFAEQHDASLIVMGDGSQGVLARLLNRHTAMRVAAATTIPILAVPTDGRPLRNPSVWTVAVATHD